MDLLEHLPSYYHDNNTMIEVQRILSEFTTELDNAKLTAVNQMFISTASMLLSRYEQIFGIETDTTKDNQYRIERIRAKVMGTNTTTIDLIKESAKIFNGSEVEVIENYNDYSFVIKFVGSKGIPLNIDNFKMTIEEIKPAHLSFTFEFTFNTWNMVSSETWEVASTMTWEQFGTYTPVRKLKI